MISENFKDLVRNILSERGISGKLSLEPLAGGANNRVFRVDVNGRSYLLKSYFRHANDPRDRLGTEYSFISFAWSNGIRCIPCPVLCDRENNLAIYEFIEGNQLVSSDLTEKEILQAINFYKDLNRCRFLDDARALPDASEACFSISEHLQNLKKIDESSEANSCALSFVNNEMMKAWNATIDNVKESIKKLNLLMDKEIDGQDRCISPSDFGFHNAIMPPDGLLRFIDFEYAGWDEPAKTVCDFFCQQAVAVPLDYYDMFAERVVSDLSGPQIQLQRIAILLPVYRIKWCCILLNDFLPVGGKRRSFALSTVDQEQGKMRQLEKARSLLRTFYS
jgi:thiamine kinase-like enzyme